MSSDSDSESISSDSNSSSISSNSIEYHEWESRVVQYNEHIDRILEDVIINYPNLVIQDQCTRARRVFRMHKHLFFHIVDAVTANDRYFQQRVDATGRLSLSPLQKCTAAMQVLAYGASFDAIDGYLRMSGAVTRKSLMAFVRGIISCFGDTYLRRPNEDDLARLLYVREQRGFPEAVASYDLWIWHAFFGTPGSCNDINVLHRSPVFSDVLEGRAPKVSYVVNGKQKNMAYYLTDGIYPSWAAFVKSITSPQIRKHRLFAQHQEAVRKDVERAFGVLQARFAFLRRPCLIWDYEQMGQIMNACIIMHNMIVEDERETYQNFDPSEFLNDAHTNGNDVVEYSTERIADLRSYMRNREQLRNREAHSSLKNDLIEHIWQKFGDDN
ncbi:putative nuclease HARBI1 [Tanacetum coccineum]